MLKNITTYIIIIILVIIFLIYSKTKIESFNSSLNLKMIVFMIFLMKIIFLKPMI